MATFRVAAGTTDLSAGALSGVANGDNVFFHEGAQTVSAGISAAGPVGALTAGLNGVLIDKSCSVSIGTAGAPWYMAAASGSDQVVNYLATAGSFYHFSYANAAPATTARVRALGNGRYFLVGGTVTNLEVGGGSADVAANVATNVYIAGGSFSSQYSATAHTLLRMSGGVANVQRNITTGVVVGGQLNVFQQTTSASPPTATTLSVEDGMLIWRGGNITTLNVEGDGMVDFSMAPVSLTITNLVMSRSAMARSKMRSSVPGVTITYPTGSNIRIYGAESDDVRGM